MARAIGRAIGMGLYSRNPDRGGLRADPREMVKQLEVSHGCLGGSVGQDGEDSKRALLSGFLGADLPTTATQLRPHTVVLVVV